MMMLLGKCRGAVLRVAMMLAGACAYLSGISASASDSPFSNGDIDFFEKSIRPVLAERCYHCHSLDAQKLRGGLRVDAREFLLRGGESGLPAIVPGDRERSRLWRAVSGAEPKLKMPPDEPLPEAQVADIAAWIKMGAPMPEPEENGRAKASASSEHWAFQPVRAFEPPPVKNGAWVRTPIDQFIVAKLEEAGIQPAPPADKRALIRRATYDLTGLPPTFEEVEAFLADESPDAFERVVDRLLASPRYGERWGRHWLDVARYADTKGYVYGDREEGRFVHSYVYRDWVIGALNEDMPYDRFVMLQVAADQMMGEGSDKRDLAAMGFLTVGRRFLGVAHDIIDDRIDTLTRGTMGLTVACARCHDHKFDPVPTDDYYSLYGVFAGSYEATVRVEARETPEFDREREALREKFQAAFDKRSAELSGRLRNQLPQYLQAALRASALPTEEFYEIRGPEDLNPLIVRRWRAYLDSKTAGDAVFGVWRALEALPEKEFAERAPGVLREALSDANRPINPRVREAFGGVKIESMEDVARIYGELISNARTQLHRAKAAAFFQGEPPPMRLADDAGEALRSVLYAADSPVLVPPGAIVDLEWWFDESVRIELAKLQKEMDVHILKTKDAPRHAVILKDRSEQRKPRVFVRGNPANLGRETERRFLSLLGGNAFSEGSGRLELARAIADPVNPLTARVIVNRVWLHHFGAGLVRTPSDFGTRSDPPSHPELLDWVAARFVAEGWSMKKLHRLIMLSSVYQQSSDAMRDSSEIDPENRLLWKFNRQRLDFEQMRDSLLMAAGTLDEARGGPPVEIFSTPFIGRRTIYGFVDRQFLPGEFRVFDFPNPDLHNPQRLDTTVPQQALFFMNSPFMLEQARNLAAAATENDKFQRIYRRAYQRDPSIVEAQLAERFIEESPEVEEPPPPPPDRGWRYGYGEYDPGADRMSNFAELPHFTGDSWQGGEKWPDEKLGWVRLTADGGHAGNDLKHAAIRRWIAPRAGTIRIDGVLDHFPNAGDGIRGRVISSLQGTLGSWTLLNAKARVSFENIKVAEGETLDFVVDIRGGLNSDEFYWSPVIEMASEPGAMEVWDAQKEFRGPAEPAATPLTPLEKYAQAILCGNEFVFID